jgi:hypothetical protein
MKRLICISILLLASCGMKGEKLIGSPQNFDPSSDGFDLQSTVRDTSVSVEAQLLYFPLSDEQTRYFTSQDDLIHSLQALDQADQTALTISGSAPQSFWIQRKWQDKVIVLSKSEKNIYLFYMRRFPYQVLRMMYDDRQGHIISLNTEPGFGGIFAYNFELNCRDSVLKDQFTDFRQNNEVILGDGALCPALSRYKPNEVPSFISQLKNGRYEDWLDLRVANTIEDLYEN